jgi:SNF2 family DNA or RNA helicase
MGCYTFEKKPHMTEKKVFYSRKPVEISVNEWQSALRRQFATEQNFKIKNIGGHPVYSDFEVFNPKSGNTYKVSIRDNIKSYNYCSCPDFTINTLGTCKHIEYVLSYFSKYKKYKKYLTERYTPDYSSLSILYGEERKVRLKKAGNDGLSDQENAIFETDGFLKPGMLEEMETFIIAAVESDTKLRVYPDVYEFIKCFKRDKGRKEIAKKLFSDGLESNVFNDLIRADLYQYQKAGVRRIVETGRILLADDMGLGKTVQAIAATEIFAKYFGVKKVLIICPTSLKFQWKLEIEKFSGRDAAVVEGLIHRRKELYADDSFYKIISYGVCHSDMKFINDMKPDLVIIDEAQRIKNWKTRTAQSVKKITSDYAIVLTGTPLENRIDELHSIVEYIDRYKLGPLFRFLDKHQILDNTGKLKGYKNLREINKTLEDVLLRRTKKEIIDQLPGRVDKNFFVEMTSEQMTDHNSYYEVVCRLVSKWIKTGFLSEEDRQKLLTCLNCMRMVCDSTYILNQNTDHGNKIGELAELLKDLLEDDENKIVIFSQWKRMFELVIKLLQKLDIPFVYLNGDIPSRERTNIIDKFRVEKELKIFLSTDAGGVGINLQSANVLINLDLPWNPAVLEQRVGRIFRLGQKKHVSVFNFISKSSIEHRILYLLDFKKLVFQGVIEEEGADEVMLEGFLESVKAMTEIDFESSAQQYAGENAFTSHNEYAIFRNSTAKDDMDMQLISEFKNPQARANDEPMKVVNIKKQGFLNILKGRINKIIKSIFIRKFS